MLRIYTSALCLALALVGTANAQDHGQQVKESQESGEHKMSTMAHGNEADQSAVRATVDALFSSMLASDADGVKSVFASNARLMTTGNREGKPFVQETPIDGFSNTVGQSAAGALDERIWNVMIHVNGNLATAWTPYALYHNGNFSHCGVNAMQLARMEDGWKIIQLTDTRQREECEIPASVSGVKR